MQCIGSGTRPCGLQCDHCCAICRLVYRLQPIALRSCGKPTLLGQSSACCAFLLLTQRRAPSLQNAMNHEVGSVVAECLSIIGCFVAPDAWLRALIPRLEDNQADTASRAAHLLTTAALVRCGSAPRVRPRSAVKRCFLDPSPSASAQKYRYGEIHIDIRIPASPHTELASNTSSYGIMSTISYRQLSMLCLSFMGQEGRNAVDITNCAAACRGVAADVSLELRPVTTAVLLPLILKSEDAQVKAGLRQLLHNILVYHPALCAEAEAEGDLLLAMMYLRSSPQAPEEQLAKLAEAAEQLMQELAAISAGGSVDALLARHRPQLICQVASLGPPLCLGQGQACSLSVHTTRGGRQA